LPPHSRPITMARADEELVAAHIKGDVMVPSNMKDVRTGLEGEVLLPKAFSAGRDNGWRKVSVIPDGNRAVIIPGTEVALGERTFLVSVKGIGARNPMYGDGPHRMGGVPARHEPTFSSEVWFGENPWGALSRKACMEDMAITEMADITDASINGFHICPMVSASALPDWVMADARDRYWYRRFDGGQFYQEVRLVPSDVRLFSQSESTLGARTPGVLRAFGIDTTGDLDWFLDNYIRSGMAALTLMARTVKDDKTSGPVALDYDDVWLDKDSVIAPDGTMFFADLEGLEWVPLGGDPDVASRIMMKQFDRNFYEFMYGLDRLLDERDRLAGRTMATKPSIRRKEVAARMEMALAQFPLLTVEASAKALHILIKPQAGPVRELDVRMLDLGGDGR